MAALKFSINGAIKFGWQITKRHFWFFVAVIIISILLNMIPEFIAGMFEENARILSMILNILSWAISIVVQMGLFKIALKFCDDEQVVISDLFSCIPLFIKYVFGAILYGLIVFVGMILLIIPGVIWAMKLQYFSYFIIDKKLGPVEALKESSRITTGIKWDVFAFCSLLIVINLIGFLCFVLGLFVTIPMTLVAYAFVYRTLQDPEYAATNEFGQIPTSRWIKWVAIIVVLGFFGMILLGIIGAIALPSFLAYRNRVHQNVEKQLESPAQEIDKKITKSEQQHIVFEDTFTDNKHAWVAKNTEECTLTISNGHYVLEHKRTQSSYCVWQSIKLYQHQDFSIEATMKKVTGVDEYGHGIIWGAKDARNRYEFCVRGNGDYTYGKMVQNEWYPIKAWIQSPYINTENGTNTLAVKKENKRIKFFINGSYVDEADFEVFFGNNIGLVVNSTQKVEIDHFLVKQSQ